MLLFFKQAETIWCTYIFYQSSNNSFPIWCVLLSKHCISHSLIYWHPGEVIKNSGTPFIFEDEKQTKY